MTLQTDTQPLTENQNSEKTAAFADTNAPLPAQPEQPQRHRRWGKIPSLPAKTRHYINQALRDDTTYEQILEKLAKDGHTHILYGNLVRWYNTGFQEWLRDHQRFEEKVLLNMDKTESEKTPPTRTKKFRALSARDFIVQFHTAARQFNLEKFCGHLEDKPEVYLRLAQTSAVHERNAIMRDRNEIELRKMRKRQKRAPKPKPGGITDAELDRLTLKMNL